jgi:hypothetical protein
MPRRKKRRTAKSFGDNPRIRRKWGEAKKFNKSEIWEVTYRKTKRRRKKK